MLDLVGRARELATVSALLEDIAGGSGAALVLRGPPGIGASHLARAAAQMAARDGIGVLWAQCEPSDLHRPLGPIEDVLAGEGLGLGLEQLERPIIDTGRPGTAVHVRIERALDRLDALTASRPALLVLDDAHHADDATLRFVAEVRARLRHHAIGLLACTPSIPPAALADLPSLVLGPIGDDEAVQLLARTLGAEPDELLRCHSAVAAGRPLQLIALARCVQGTGPQAAVAMASVANVDDVVPFQLSLLEPSVRNVGLAVAVLGRDADDDTLSFVLADQPAGSIADALAVLAAQGIVGRDPSGQRWRPHHELYRSGLTAGASVAALATMHGAAASALATRGGDPLRIAEHELVAARLDRGALQAAIRTSARSVAPHEPAAALALLDRVGGADEDDATVVARTLALGSLGRVAELEQLARSYLHDHPGGAAEIAVRRELAFALFTQNRALEAAEEMDRLLVLLDSDAARARALAESSFAAAVAIDFVGARDRAERALGEPRADAGTQSIAHSVLSVLDHFTLRMVDGLDHADRAVALAQRPDGREGRRYQPWFCAALAYLQADRLDVAGQLVAEGRLVADATGAVWALPGYDALHAFVAFRAGRLDEAEAAGLAVLPSIGESDGLRVGAWAHAFAGLSALHRESIDDAIAHAAAARALLDSGEVTLGNDQAALLEATLSIRRGEFVEAREQLWPMWALLDAIGVPAAQASLGVELARACMATDDVARAREVADWYRATEPCGVPGVVLASAHVAMLVEPSRDRAVAVMARAGGCPRPLERAVALGDAADVLVAVGDTVGAEEARAEAVRTYGACGSTIGVAMLGSRQRRPGRPRHGWDALTAAERAVLRVLAEGASNAEIAERLRISKRTVEVHVSAAYRKLDVTTRVALARLALAHP